VYRCVPIRAGLAAFVAGLVLALAACGDDASGPAGPTTQSPAGDPTETQRQQADARPTLRILVTNDDGTDHEAIDVLAAALDGMGDVEISVVAPADNRSGTSDQTTPEPRWAPARTPAGREAVAVDGFPADSVVVGLDELGLDPHLVVSGVNPGQNVGPFAEISGTVGAARTALRRGIPAVAVSAGLEFDAEQFEFAASLAVDWIDEHRGSLVAGTQPASMVVSFNIPACPIDDMGELVEVPRATELPEEGNVFESTCDQADPDPVDDIAAIIAGYPALTFVPPDL
jgi:5'-nucleotidase